MKLFFLFASCRCFMKKDTLKSWKSPALTKGTCTFLFSVCVWLCVYSWIGHGECVEGRLCHVGSGIELSALIYITRLPICISMGSLLPISFRLDIIHCCGHLFLLFLWSFAFFIVLSHLTSRLSPGPLPHPCPDFSDHMLPLVNALPILLVLWQVPQAWMMVLQLHLVANG